tara:strand:- start:61273 stop:63450 length:2178 start_codon:yes stop_codon:yes gene_type:complete
VEKKWFESDWVYDLESYPNCFSMTIIHASGKHLRQYEISDRKDETDALANCLRYLLKNKCRMVGYNNLSYDYTLIHEIIQELVAAKADGRTPRITAAAMYKTTMQIIKKMNESDDKWYGIKEDDHFIKQVDLYKIHHFDNAAKATSLKMLEVNMRSENVEDLPFDVGTILSPNQIDTLLKYNTHDVMETLKFYYYSNEALQLRVELSEKFGFDCTNFSDSKIGETLFINRLEEQKKGICYTVGKYGRKVNQTKRDNIPLKDCLFDYIQFKRPEFQAVHKWLENQVVSETKGVFNDYEEHQIGELAQYAMMKEKKVLLKNRFKLDSKDKPKAEFDVEDEQHMQELERLKKEFLAEHPCGYFEEKETKTKKIHRLKVNGLYRVVESINTVVDGGHYVYGTGGIHMSVEGQIVQDDENWKIIDADVTSMYPSISIANNVYPEHLGLTFCKVYKDLFTERGKYPKGSGPNGAIKLALNSVYGKSNSEFSPLYDPKYTLTITVNGQLSLSMLAEQFLDIGCKIIQCNTDGVTALVPRDKEDQYYEITKQWEKTVGLKLEYAVYKMMALADVNNYLAVYEDGKVKSKGRYEVAHYEKLGWSKNHSAMIVSIAAMEYIVNGVPVEKTIRAHKDEFDFLLRAKIPRSSKLYLVYDDGREVKQQNICRYYPSEYGGKLVKLMPGLKQGDDWRRLGIDTEWSVETCNNIKEFDWTKLNYDYYVTEANKLVTAVGG